jgi:hypothetical protein
MNICAVYEAPGPAARFMVFSGVVFPRCSALTLTCFKDRRGTLPQFDNRRETPRRTCITALQGVSQKRILNLFVRYYRVKRQRASGNLVL